MDQPLIKRCSAEFLGTLWLVFGGCGTAMFATGLTGERATVGLLGVSFALGLTVVTGAYAFGHISGGHFNPAVTVGLSVAKRFAWGEVPAYVIAQVAGAISGSGLLWAIAEDAPIIGGFELKYGSLASNGFRDGYFGLGGVLIAETFLTFMFLLIILGATHSKASTKFAGLSIGLGLTLIHLISIPISNTSVNPARSTGPAIFEGGKAINQLWVFWLAPVLGAVVAGFAYAWLRPESGDEPDVDGDDGDDGEPVTVEPEVAGD